MSAKDVAVGYHTNGSYRTRRIYRVPTLTQHAVYTTPNGFKLLESPAHASTRRAIKENVTAVTGSRHQKTD